jgi:hypothetical protein
MKLNSINTASSQRPRSGLAVIVVMGIIAIIMIFVAGNLKSLARLGQELKLLERRQVRRLQTSAAGTNQLFHAEAPGVRLQAATLAPSGTNSPAPQAPWTALAPSKSH